MSMDAVSVRSRIARGGIMCITLCAAALLLFSGCAGGFETDNENASEIGPAIFKPDSAKQEGKQ